MIKKITCLLTVGCLFMETAVNAADTAGRLNAMRNDLTRIEALLEECEQAGIDTGYERVDYGVIRDFIEYGKQDEEWGDTQRAEYVADTLEQLYNGVLSKLNAYRNSAASPFPVIRNLPENYGGALNGDFISKDGTPIINNGFGVFEQLKNDIPKMQEFGADLVQIEIGPNNVIVPHGTVNGWSSTPYGNAQAEANIVEGAGVDGSACLKITNASSAANSYLSVNQTVSVKPNTRYTLSFYAKTENSGAFSYSMQGWTAPRNNIARGTQPWTKYTTAYTTGADEYSLEILFVSSQASDAVYLDGITILEDGENIIQNGDFEDQESDKSENFQANTASIRDRVVRTLDRAQKNDVMVNVLISPHYFPSWVLQQYPQVRDIDSGLGYNINDPIIKEALDLYIKTLMNEIRTHPALHSICITNEPKCITRGQSNLLPEYAAYLESVHGDINTLNSIYKKSYKSFSEVPMPSRDTMDAAYYDWVQFNNKYTAEWHRYLANTVKKYAPDIAVHSKIMTIFGNDDSLNYGIDPEDFAEFTDYNGNDAWGFYGSDASGLISKLAWYDLLKSIKPEAPIINSEDHITEDGNTNYNERQAVHVAADIWQGAIHGRDASIIWIWGRTPNKNASTYGNILYRPDVLSAVGKKSLDLNRLSGKVSVLQKAENDVTILYSPSSRAYSKNMIRTLLHTYEAALYAGANPKFITERQLADGMEPEGVLILPETQNIADDAYNTIAAYSARGGKIIALGTGCLSRDEYNRERADVIALEDVLAVERSGGTIIKPNKMELQMLITETAGIDPLKDTYGETVTGVERIATETEDGVLWNLCNYIWDAEKQISFDGYALDLLTGTIHEGYIDLKPFTPVLLEFGSIEDAAITASIDCRRQGESCTLVIELTNSGDLPDTLDAALTIRTADGSEPVKGIHFSKYLSGHCKTKLSYSFTLKEGEYTAVLRGRYENGKKELGELQISVN